MNRITILLVAVVFGLATAANSATMTVTADKTSYLPGETITLTIVGTVIFNPPTTIEQAKSFLGDLQASNAGTPTFVSADTAVVSTPWAATNSWSVGGQQGLIQGDGDLRVWDQLWGVTSSTITNTPLTAIVTYLAGSAGTASFTWSPLNFFGAAGGLAETVNIVPEPGTLLLLGAGMGGLVLLGRRRS